jgi:hypothetical protein
MKLLLSGDRLMRDREGNKRKLEYSTEYFVELRLMRGATPPP